MKGTIGFSVYDLGRIGHGLNLRLGQAPQIMHDPESIPNLETEMVNALARLELLKVNDVSLAKQYLTRLSHSERQVEGDLIGMGYGYLLKAFNDEAKESLTVVDVMESAVFTDRVHAAAFIELFFKHREILAKGHGVPVIV